MVGVFVTVCIAWRSDQRPQAGHACGVEPCARVCASVRARLRGEAAEDSRAPCIRARTGANELFVTSPCHARSHNACSKRCSSIREAAIHQ